MFDLEWPHPSTGNKRSLVGIYAWASLKSCLNLKNKAQAGFRLLHGLMLLDEHP